jgi:hypothetical protein
MLFSILKAEEIRQGVEEVNLFEDVSQEGHQVVEDLQAEEDIPFQDNNHHRYHHHLQDVL